MKILIYGAGTIGCTYGWQLSKAGCEVTLLVKSSRKSDVEKKGIPICCSDFRGNKKEVVTEIFYPQITDGLFPDNQFDYIFVTVGSVHLKEVLPVLSENSGNAHVLFFQNIGFHGLELINEYLSEDRFFFGFPFMVGGTKTNESINSIILDSKYSKTMLGEINGKTSSRLQKIYEVLELANMKPFISEQIVNWLLPHYVFIAVLSGGIIRADGKMCNFLRNSDLIKESIKAIREGFNICKVIGVDPKKEKVNQLYYFPMFICVPLIRKIFKNEAMSTMFEEFLLHGSKEIRFMLKDVIQQGKFHNQPITYLTKQLDLIN